MTLSELPELLARYEVILKPDKNEPEWWAGAPSVVRDRSGIFTMAARMREGYSPRGSRGYEIRILQSEDGIQFHEVHSLKREALGVQGVERPALVLHPETGKFRLIFCASYPEGWKLLQLDDVIVPSEFDASTARIIMEGVPDPDGYVRVVGYKDPVVFISGSTWHLFTIGGDVVERIHHFTSQDGNEWTPALPFPIVENSGWHRFYTRPASILPLDVGYLFVYEGSDIGWHDPVYNIATGIAYSPDLFRAIDLTPEEPLLRSDTADLYYTWRYSQWLHAGNHIFIYFECAAGNGTNEIRCSVIPRSGLLT